MVWGPVAVTVVVIYSGHKLQASRRCLVVEFENVLYRVVSIVFSLACFCLSTDCPDVIICHRLLYDEAFKCKLSTKDPANNKRGLNFRWESKAIESRVFYSRKKYYLPLFSSKFFYTQKYDQYQYDWFGFAEKALNVVVVNEYLLIRVLGDHRKMEQTPSSWKISHSWK